MNVESITHEPIENTDNVLSTVIINQVSSQCILARLLIDVLGKPGIDNDMEMMGTGNTWTIIWTQSSSVIEETQT